MSKEFFVEAGDSFTNQVIVDAQLKLNKPDEPEPIEVTGGDRRLLFSADFNLIARLHKSRDNIPVKFRVWARKGQNQRAHRWDLYKRRKKTVKQVIAEMKKKGH
ncbi:MAG TPA: hypothetical protein VKP03_00140 [Patescibacteria group bacterium]|nr:hypothetical protein [Patescibacteria group bacterium]